MGRNPKDEAWYPADWNTLAVERLQSGEMSFAEAWEVVEAVRFMESKRGSVDIFTDKIDGLFHDRHGVQVVREWPMVGNEFEVRLVRDKDVVA
jgi:hypothetical protein